MAEDEFEKNVEGIEAGSETEGELAEGAKPVCPNCLKELDPRQNYCENCGSEQVNNPLASYMPFESIKYIYGTLSRAWVKAWKFEYSWSVSVLSIIFIGLYWPIVIVLSIPPFLTGWIKDEKVRDKVMFLLYAAFAVWVFWMVIQR